MTLIDAYNLIPPYGIFSGQVSVTSLNAMGDILVPNNTASASGAWPANNRAIFVPFELAVHATFYKAWTNIGTSSGNIDFGIYDLAGNRLGSAGSTASPGTGFHIVDISDTTLQPGNYYMAMAASTTGFLPSRWASPALQIMTSFGLGDMASALALPNPATIAVATSAYIPLFGLIGRSDGVQ